MAERIWQANQFGDNNNYYYIIFLHQTLHLYAKFYLVPFYLRGMPSSYCINLPSS